MTPKDIEIRHCDTVEEYWACVDLERRIWEGEDVDLVPPTVFVVVRHTGGQVFGAFDPERGGQMIGFTLAMPAFREGRHYLHSHMTAVLPEYQNRGVGRRLKLFQREEALGRGLELVEWTFDPLEIRNAYFNLERLGAIMRRYHADFYGRTSSPLHANLPTDRLVAEWWLRAPRVEALAAGRSLPRGAGAGKDRVRILVPANIAELRRAAPEEAARVLGRIREQFQQWFARGYVATGMEMSAEGGSYLLEPAEGIEGDPRADGAHDLAVCWSLRKGRRIGP
jgi:predicted GNAT superfamily acetyltransferase